ncbi:MAG: hypothetical protein PQJ58_22110 [Spirochaetales bacterium]|nr:hypothetical protein [Spirochaetales bacterium]
MEEVDFDDLDFWDGYYLDEKPFTGIAYEKDSRGVILSEYTFVSGAESGPQKEFYSNGNKKELIHLYFGWHHGLSYEWYEDGTLKFESLLEYGIVIWQKQYDEKGKILLDYTLGKEDDDYKKLMEWREKKNWPISPRMEF